jgi:hypothetical protein
LNEEDRTKLKDWQTSVPKKKPGPQSYWKTQAFSKVSKKSTGKPAKYVTVVNSDESKTLFIDRKITDKAIYKPCSSVIF